MNIGGPAIHVSLLSSGLDQSGYENMLLAGTAEQHEGSLAELAFFKKTRLLEVSSLGREIRFLADLRALKEVRHAIRAFQPSIVHTHTAKAGFIGRVAAWLEGVPCIHTFHGHVLSGYFSPLKEKIFQTIERILAKKTDCIVAVSQQVASDLLALGVGQREQIKVVPLGLELEPFLAVKPHSLLKEKLGIPCNHFAIGAVGRLAPVKNIEFLIRCFARVAQTNTGLHLILVGDGPERSNLEVLTQTLGVRQKIHFLGWRKDLSHIYGGLDIVALTSVNEGTPVAIIEALASGRPVVATSVGGVPEVLENGALGKLVPPGDEGAFCEALQELCLKPIPLAEAYRERVVQKYSVQNLVQTMDKLYRQTLDMKMDRSPK
jgi:glycosyltransferase involved in cell wall biosynthesis